ncbi:hypothetical protein CSUI_009296 [Cystoisospora suis]|uniref:Uncharacterized protein n=1 Tax=Cystoisospora suis TaxID=483139 RepID=A0A2C6KH65_9APIC|nr:hypothetical protein CSUI_009296 [Cystoisospora suis]
MHVSRSWTGRAVGLVSPSLAPGDHHGPGTSKAVSGLGAFEGPLLPYHSCRSSFSQPCRHAFPSTTRRLRSSPLRHGTLYSNARRLWWLASLFQVVMCMHLGPWMSQGVSATHSGDAPPHSGHILDHLTKRSGHSIMSFPRGLSDDRLPEHEEKVTTLESAHDTSREKLTFTRVEETETNTYEAQDGLYSRSAVQSLKFQHDWSRARPPLGSDSLSPTISPARDFYGFEASPHARAVGLNGSRSALLSSVDLGTAEDGLEFGTGTPLDESAEKSFHRTDRLLHLGSRRLLAQESGPDSSGSSTDEPQKSKDGDSGRATMLTHHNDPEWKGESTPAPSADRGNSTRHETIDRGDGTSMSDTKDDGGQWGSTHRGRQQPDQEQGESELRGQAVQQQGPLISGSDVQDTQRETGVMNPSRWETASTTGGGREAGNTGTSLPSSVGRSAWWGPPHAVSRGTDRSGEIKVKKRSTEQLFQSSRNDHKNRACSDVSIETSRPCVHWQHRGVLPRLRSTFLSPCEGAVMSESAYAQQHVENVCSVASSSSRVADLYKLPTGDRGFFDES